MDDSESFRTLRGFLNGDEPDEEIYFAYSATLRLTGVIPDLDLITQTLGLVPTQALRKGQRSRPRSTPIDHDCWHYTPDVAESEPLSAHIDTLWADISAHRDFIKSLRPDVTLDVFLGYRSNCDHAGVEVPHTSLEMFTELEIPFGVSIIIT